MTESLHLKVAYCPACKQQVVEIGEGTAVTCVCTCGELLSVEWKKEEHAEN